MAAARFSRRAALAALVGAMVTAILAVAAGADRAEASFLRGFADPAFKNSDPVTQGQLLDHAAGLGAEITRVDVSWRGVAPDRPADPTDPADPGYDFSRFDAALRAAAARGQALIVTVSSVPNWAEATKEPTHIPPGTWDPDPAEFRLFAQAVGERYSGAFTPAGSLEPLPRVAYFEPWNEPNISIFINPQWHQDNPLSPEIYRRLLNAFYEGVNQTNPSAKVIAGSTAPFGDDGGPGALRVRPLEFMRELLCLKGRKKLEAIDCGQKPKFDIYSHHPINVYGGPRDGAQHPDDINAAIDMDQVKKTLRAASREGTIRPKGKKPLWATEMFWETAPPDQRFGHTLRQQAYWIEDAFYLLDRVGVNLGMSYQLIDSPGAPNGLQAGLLFEDQEPKPSTRTFEFPFVTQRRTKSRITAWTIPPASGELLIQKKQKQGWRTIKRAQVREDRPFKTKVKLGHQAQLRARVGQERSMTWGQPAKRNKKLARGSLQAAGAPSPSTTRYSPERLEYLLPQPPTP